MQASAPKPILLGRHLMELGMKPGPAFGQILAAAVDAQLEGTFLDLPKAWIWLAEQQSVALPEPAQATLRLKLTEKK